MPTKPETTTSPVKKTAVKKAVVKKAVAVKAESTPTVTKAKPVATGKYVFATGRRKTSVATAKIFDTTGTLTVNSKPADKYFTKNLLTIATRPFQITGRGSSLATSIIVKGGGQNSQAEAISLALARALVLQDGELRLTLKKNGLLTRDAREKERKKPGLKRARRSPQWAKR